MGRHEFDCIPADIYTFLTGQDAKGLICWRKRRSGAVSWRAFYEKMARRESEIRGGEGAWDREDSGRTPVDGLTGIVVQDWAQQGGAHLESNLRHPAELLLKNDLLACGHSVGN